MSDFVKFQALGNDYIVVDPHRTDFLPTPASVRLLCDRHFGVGGDGVLFGPVGPVLPDRPVPLRIFNSDGSECEKSGNGLRMFALYLHENYPVDDALVIVTPAGPSAVRILDRAEGMVSVEMGRPTFDAADIPVAGRTGSMISRPLQVDGSELLVTCLHIGNPHTVVLLDTISRELAHELGPAIAHHRIFPRGTNVQLLRVRSRQAIEIEIWERGAGYTLASGSSSCAAASAAFALGLVDGAVEVGMPGGVLQLAIAEDRSVTMTGAAEQVASGWFAATFRDRLGWPRQAPTDHFFGDLMEVQP